MLQNHISKPEKKNRYITENPDLPGFVYFGGDTQLRSNMKLVEYAINQLSSTLSVICSHQPLKLFISTS
jgi:hypothetical protein